MPDYPKLAKGLTSVVRGADEVAPAAVTAVSAAKAAKNARAFSDNLLQSNTAKIMEELMAANPKLTPEAAFKKAGEQAERKLTWEKETKPALVKQYGPLARASYEKTKVNKMQNTNEAVQKRIQKANDFLDQPTEPWTPPRPELQAFDRKSIQDALEGFPGVEQTAFPRDVPTRASTSHVEGLYTDPVNRELIKKQIMRGLPLGGETFYGSLYPIKQAVLEAGMPAEKFDKWVHSLAPASARNSIINETAVGQFLRDMNARGIPLTEENVATEMAKYSQKFGVSLPLMPVHRQGVANVLEGGQDLREMSKANIPTNYKIPTYGTQKTGDFGKSVVLDVHEAAGQTQGSKYHPYFKEQGGFGNTEYNAGEQGMMGIADELGIPGGMAQAGRWFGGGELTGLKSPRGDALDILERQVAYTLQQQGRQPNPANIREEILNQIRTGEGQLLPWYKSEGIPDVRETGLQRKDGGDVHNTTFTGGLSSIKNHFPDGGPVVTSPEDFQKQWSAYAGKTDDASVSARQALSSALENYQTNQNVQNLYNLDKGNANTFIADASAGLAPLSQGQDPDTQTYTPEAFKTMTAFEQALTAGNNQSTLAGRQNAANALMKEFQGTGDNPLLGQYNQLSGGTILPWQNGVPTPGMAGTSASSASVSSTPTANNTTSANASVKPLGILGTSTLIPGFSYPSSDASNTQPPVATDTRTDPATLKKIYGITNPALLTYIASTPELRDVDIKNLTLAFNSKTPQEVNALQTSGSTLNDLAYKELRNQEAEIQRKKDIANPNSWLYAKNTYDPTKDIKRQAMMFGQYAQDNQYSPLLNADEKSPSAKLNELKDMYKNQLDVKKDAMGFTHINTSEGIYTFDKNGKPVGFNLPSSDYRSQVQQTGTPNNLIDKYGNLSASDGFNQFGIYTGKKDGGSISGGSFTQRLNAAIERHMAGGGVVNMSDTTPDITDGENIIQHSFYAKGGNVHMPVRSLKQLKSTRLTGQSHFDDGGYVDPLGAPDYQTGQTKNLAEIAGRMIRDQASKEGAVLSTPEGRRDIALKVASHMPGLGMGGDLVALADWVQTLIPGLYEEKPASVLDTKRAPAPFRDTRELQRVPKFPLSNIVTTPSGEAFQEKFKEMGIQGESEAPVTEFIGSMLTPGAIAKAPKAPRAIEGGLNSVTAAARRPFTPATGTVEAVSPDLAKFKNQPFQDYVTKQMIGEGAAVPMTTMGGRRTTQKAGQGAYLNEAGELEYNPMLGVTIPRAGNLSTNKALRADMATAGQELGQEAMAAHRFVPMLTNQIKDASAMMIRGPGGRPLTNEQVKALANELPGMIATHSPANGGLLVAPFGMTKGQVPKEFLTAQSVARKILGKDAKIQFGKADEKKDLMYMPRSTYVEEGGRGTSAEVQDIRNKLKRMDKNFATQ